MGLNFIVKIRFKDLAAIDSRKVRSKDQTSIGLHSTNVVSQAFEPGAKKYNIHVCGPVYL